MDYQIDNLQFAVFTPSAPLGQALSTWKRVFKLDPEGMAPMATGGQQISRRIHRNQTHLQIQPGRLDIMIMPYEDPPSPGLPPQAPGVLNEPFKAIEFGIEKASQLIEQGSAQRIAIVINAHVDCKSDHEVTLRFQEDVPGFPVAPQTSDFQYHFTQSRAIKGMDQRDCTCICRWIAGRRGFVYFDVARVGSGPLVTDVTPVIGRYIDVATRDTQPVPVLDLQKCFEAISKEATSFLEQGFSYAQS